MKNILKLVAALVLTASFFNASAQGHGKMAASKMTKKHKAHKSTMKAKSVSATPAAPAATPAPKM